MCDVIGDQLYLAIYDTGTGIPNTVTKKQWFFKTLKAIYPDIYTDLTAANQQNAETAIKDIPSKRVTSMTDSEKIYISMLGDVSGTNEDKHGQGSKSIKALVDNTTEGILWVYSNQGVYTFHQGDTHPKLNQLPSKMPGTLVQWNITL